MDALGARGAIGWLRGPRQRTFRYGRQTCRGRGRFDLRDLKRHGVRYTGAVDVAGRAALSVQLTSDPHVRSC
jgi:hypothetical protein